MPKSREGRKEPALTRLRDLARELADAVSGISGRQATLVRREIGLIVEELARVQVRLDPVREPESVFDPSNPRTVGRFVGIALVAQDRYPLSSVPSFYGSGVYALYYAGHFQPYCPNAQSETRSTSVRPTPGTRAQRLRVNRDKDFRDGSKTTLERYGKQLQRSTSPIFRVDISSCKVAGRLPQKTI